MFFNGNSNDSIYLVFNAVKYDTLSSVLQLTNWVTVQGTTDLTSSVSPLPNSITHPRETRKNSLMEYPSKQVRRGSSIPRSRERKTKKKLFESIS